MSNEKLKLPLCGKCSCGSARYRMLQAPLIVHCCHCTYCQRQTGSAFVINALIETSRVELLEGEVTETTIASGSGAGQTVVRCSHCQSTLWSHYLAASDRIAFVRVGTLDHPHVCSPDIHIYTSTKQSWFEPGNRVPVVPEFYDGGEVWPEESLKRYRKALGG